jgi:hypothetical protein
MVRKSPQRRHTSPDYQPFDLVSEPPGEGGPGEARRFLKHLDRRLQRFSTRIDSLERRANRLSDDDDSDLILAVESLHRETLLLRAEIRERLAGDRQSWVEMTEYAEESWQQLRETFEELKESLAPESSAAKRPAPRADAENNEDEEAWAWDEDEWLEPDHPWTDSGIHPPRPGPKR